MVKFLRKLIGKKSNGIKLDMVSEDQKWNETDAAMLRAFLTTDAGKKLINNLQYTIYDYVMDARPSTEIRRGICSGLAIAVHQIKNGAMPENFRENMEEGKSEEGDELPHVIDF